MDAPEEDLDIKLQKISGDFIQAFDKALPALLRKSDGEGGTRARSMVRTRDLAKLIAMYLEPFQELPQLLDPHLARWLPPIAATYLEYLQTSRRRPRQAQQALSTASQLLLPLSAAACRLLYTFCKVRGEKVVVGFLPVDTRYLELLLSAMTAAEGRAEGRAADHDGAAAVTPVWAWEERYVVLLWLSQLFLAPFDLATISSGDVDADDDDDLPAIHGFAWPAAVPGVAVRVLPLAVKYLASPGKERDAAKALLVRIAMRRDMQQLGVLDALVRWALFSLRPRPDEPARSSYHYIGVLSFLAGILISSSDASDLDRYLPAIFQATHAVATRDEPGCRAVVSVALARKMVIKVVRSVAVQLLRRPRLDAADTEVVETTVGHLLESLADNDTPVRLAASKALSIVTRKLDPDMASQVVDAVLTSLNHNVVWARRADPAAPRTRDLTSVDPLQWHGLMLTLSHLLYRRSPPAADLADIVHALLLGLAFERRSAAGVATGANVRDAACFGIWALARRYTTAELQAVPTASLSVAGAHGPAPASVLQLLATELVVTASLDPAGNIRRGSSAALQELIGRHPDTVEQGVWLVQAVDYHAVALRSRAVGDVAMAATRLAARYGAALLDALLGWRGVGDGDTAARRVAAAAFGAVAAQLALGGGGGGGHPLLAFRDAVDLVVGRLAGLQQRQVEERHGLVLSLAAVFDAFPTLAGKAGADAPAAAPGGDRLETECLQRSVAALSLILDECRRTTFRRPELVAEAASRLVVSALPVLQAATLGPARVAGVILLPGPRVLAGAHTADWTALLAALDASHINQAAAAAALPPELARLMHENLDEWLARPEDDVIAAASHAALVLLLFSPPPTRAALTAAWAELVTRSARTGAGFGFFFALAMAHPVLSRPPPPSAPDDDDGDGAAVACDALLARWAADTRVESRVALLQALTRSDLLAARAPRFLALVAEGLDDYTTTARGDVGSHVRLEALRATKRLWRPIHDSGDADAPAEAREHLAEITRRLFLRVLRLAAEKLDRVRVEAQAVLALALKKEHAVRLNRSTFSSRKYFRYLLGLVTNDHLHPVAAGAVAGDPDGGMQALLAGYVTSADTGDEALVIASRAALAEYCAAAAANRERACVALVRNLAPAPAATAATAAAAAAGGRPDRTTVATLEVLAYLAHAGALARCRNVDYVRLCRLVQMAAYKTGNVRKLEACARVYGAVAGLLPAGASGEDEGGEDDKDEGGEGGAREGDATRRAEGAREARRRLAALMYHPWPRIRSLVADELWGVIGVSSGGGGAVGAGGAGAEARAQGSAEMLLGVDWGRADKARVKRLVEEELRLV